MFIIGLQELKGKSELKLDGVEISQICGGKSIYERCFYLNGEKLESLDSFDLDGDRKCGHGQIFGRNRQLSRS